MKNIEGIFIILSASIQPLADALDNISGDLFAFTQGNKRHEFNFWFYSRENDRLRWMWGAK